MHPINNIVGEIVDYNNIYESFDYVMRGRRKKSKRGRYIIKNRDKIVEEIRQTILNGTFHIGRYFHKEINERGKSRTIQCINLESRILLNSVMKVVEKHITPRLIKDTAASIKGRGMHYIHERMKKGMIIDPEGTGYTFQSDYKKCYPNLNQDKVWEVTKHYIRDRYVLKILKECIYMLDSGLSIGLRSSQCLTNLYISHCVGQKLKGAGLKYLRIYCDDITFQTGSYYELTKYIRILKKCSEDADLTIKNNYRIFRTSSKEIDAYGYKTYNDGHVLLRNHIKKRFAKRWKRVKSKNRKIQLIGSFYGVSKHANAKHLFRKITHIDMNKFAELGLKYEPEDGKEMIRAEQHSIMDVINREIAIINAVDGVTTQNGERMIIEYNCGSEHGKFFTGSKEIIQLVRKAKERNLIPFECTIRKISTGNGHFNFTMQ